MPPYRTPEFGKVIVRSVFDRTLFVLGRSVLVAAPTGLILWILANVKIGDANLLIQVSELLSPIGELLGMDGAIILAFILALPANEILIPIILMIYTSGGSLLEYSNLTELMAILSKNGWTAVTALCVLIFTLFHWPCSTTLMTIKKESGKLRWAILSAILPTAVGALICLFISFLSKLIF
jgi:ferrous iron transport protein B